MFLYCWIQSAGTKRMCQCPGLTNAMKERGRDGLDGVQSGAGWARFAACWERGN